MPSSSMMDFSTGTRVMVMIMLSLKYWSLSAILAINLVHLSKPNPAITVDLAIVKNVPLIFICKSPFVKEVAFNMIYKLSTINYQPFTP